MRMNKAIIAKHIENPIITKAKGFKLDALLVAYEGWRRGLKLTWYRNETDVCTLSRLRSSTSGKFFSLESADKKHYFFRSRGDKVANETVILVQNKDKTKKILEQQNVPVPQGKKIQVKNTQEILKYAKDIGFPVVVKPTEGSMGRGVFTNIKNEVELNEIINYYQEETRYRTCILEKYYAGREYRIYVVGDNVAAITYRVPANVIGDGKSTIEKLIKLKNKERKKNPYLASKPIKINKETERNLHESDLSLTSIPKKDEQVFLQTLSNLSMGGDPIDAMEEVSEEIKKVAINALKALPSIDHAGIDIIVDSENKDKGVVLEVNATAEIAFHLFPLEGKTQDVPKAIIDHYFPETVDNPKSQFYFDYESTLIPLSTWAADELVVPIAPQGSLYSKKYTIKGKVTKVGYLNFIKRNALMKNIHGYAKSNKGIVDITLIGTDLEELKAFEKICLKGSKRSRVDNLESETLEVNEDDYFQIGFQIITETSK